MLKWVDACAGEVPTMDVRAGVEIEAPTDHDAGIASSSPSTDPHYACVWYAKMTNHVPAAGRNFLANDLHQRY